MVTMSSAGLKGGKEDASASTRRATSSPLPLHSSREEACPNCDGSLTSDHQCDSESDCDEEDDDDEEEQVAEGERLKAEREAMYQMLLQINASNPFMKKNSD